MDNQLLQQLYGRYYKEIYAYLYTLCKNREAAEDLTQETFLKALLNLPDDHPNMRAWLYRVARNLFYNYAKKDREQPEPDPRGGEAAEDDPQKALEQKDRSQALLLAMDRLSPTKRELVRLRYFAGLPEKEIAARTGLSGGNVRVLLLRARRELKDMLEDE